MGSRDLCGGIRPPPPLRAPPPTSSCKVAGKRPSFTFSITVVTPDGRGAGTQESWVSDNLGIPQVLYSFSDCEGCPQGRRTGYKCSSRLCTYLCGTNQICRPAHEVDSTHREKDCVVGRGSLTESWWMDNHRMRAGLGRLREEERMQTHTFLGGTARKSWNLVQGETHLTTHGPQIRAEKCTGFAGILEL